MPDGFITTLGDEDALRIIVKQQRKEIDRLKEAIRRLADQDATLSFCGGDVTVTVDESPRWIPVGERLPPFGDDVLVHKPHIEPEVASRKNLRCYFDHRAEAGLPPDWCWETPHGVVLDSPLPTHWMPLPEPPTTVTEQT